MSNDEHKLANKLNFIDLQQLNNSKMATITSSVNSTIQNSLAERVLNSELTNYVTTSKLDNNEIQNEDNLANLNGNLEFKQKKNNVTTLNDLKQLKTELNDDQARFKLNGNDNLTDLNRDLNKLIDLIENDKENELFLIINSSTNAYFSKDNLTDLNNNLIDLNEDTDLNNNIIDLNEDTDLNNNIINNKTVDQLKDIFHTIRQSVSNTITNPLTNTNNQMTNLLIEKNLSFNQFYNSSSSLTGKLNEDKLNGRLAINNNNIDQFNLNGSDRATEHQISKLIADDYLSEHNDHRSLINNQFKLEQHISEPIDNQINRQNNKEQEEEEIYEDVDNNVDLNTKANCSDIDLMKTDLAKLKLTKDQDNLSNSPLNDDADFFDALDDDDDNEEEEEGRRRRRRGGRRDTCTND